MKRALPIAILAVLIVAGVTISLSVGDDGGSQTRPDDQSGLVSTPGEELTRSIGRPADGTPMYISLVGDAWRPIFGEENWQKNIVDDDKKVAVTDSAVFQEAATEFQDFPLYWLGLEFQGLPLTGITRSYRQHVTPPEDHVILKYGTCTPPREGGCSPPLQVRLEPYCYAQPAGYVPEAKDGAIFKVRGASAQYIGGGLQLWMGSVAVKLYAHPEERMLEAAEALVATYGTGPATADQQFPPLDSDCSDFTLEP